MARFAQRGPRVPPRALRGGRREGGLEPDTPINGIREVEVRTWGGKLGNLPFCPEPGAGGKELGGGKGGFWGWIPAA